MRGEGRGGVHTADLTFIVALPRNLIISQQIIIKHLWFGANTQRTQLIRDHLPPCTPRNCHGRAGFPKIRPRCIICDHSLESPESSQLLDTIAPDVHTYISPSLCVW